MENAIVNKINVNFSQAVGAIKPLHGVNNGPKTGAFHFDMSKYFADAGIPYSRLHDTEYPYGSGHFVDIHCVFPDFDADPDDPAAYDFWCTDEYIRAIIAAGTKVFYRLGESIEHPVKKYHIFPPQDYDKWAKICAAIIRHYNDGWADGFHYGIEYWEIWNEPENPPCWQGTKEDYFKLYVKTAKYLKALFPGIKVGGYAGCGFYSLTRENTTYFQKGFITYFTDFLRYISAPENNAPLDFYSWHLYSTSVEEMIAHAAHVKKTLVEYGFDKTENIVDEWNHFSDTEDRVERRKTMEAAAFIAGVFCALQKSSVDIGVYYDAQPAFPLYCGIFDTKGPRKPFYAFKAYNCLYALGREVSVVSEIERVYVCAASSDTQGAMLLSNYGGDRVDVTVEISGFAGAQNGVRLEYYHLDETSDLDLKRSEIYNGNSFNPVLTLDKNSVVLLKAIRL